MRSTWTKLVCLAALLAVPSTSAVADRTEQVDQQAEQEAYEARQEYGYRNVVLFADAVDGFKSGQISEAELITMAWEADPVLASSLYAQWGEFNTCFLMDLVMGQSNGVIAYDPEGQPRFFDPPVFGKDAQISTLGDDDEKALEEANEVLRGVLEDWYDDPLCRNYPPMNNKCCDSSTGLEKCIPRTGSRCKMDALDQNCVPGSTQC